MRKIVIVLGGIMLFTACGKDNIEWIKPWHDYTSDEIYELNGNGNEILISQNLFPKADKISFLKNHTGFSVMVR